MSNPKAIAYDLGIALGSIGLWLTPFDITRAIGYATSIVFSGRAYYTGVCLLSQERKSDEVDAMTYDASVDFHERLLDSTMELKLTQLENKFTEYLIPLAAHKRHLEQQLSRVLPHPELSDEDREQAAKSAIESAFVETENHSDRENEINIESVREKFPEQMDSTSWKAILKALGNGASKEEIIKDVLGGEVKISAEYYEILKKKFL